MKIAFDGRPIVARWTGDRTYLVNIIRYCACVHPEGEYHIYFREGDPDPTLTSLTSHTSHTSHTPTLPYSHTRPLVRWRRLPSPMGWMWTFFAVPAAARRDRLDLFHADYIVPLHCPCPTIVTIHDAISMLFIEAASIKLRVQTNLLTFLSAQRATFVITASESAKQDIARLFRVKPEKVKVTPYGVDEAFRPIDRELARRFVRERYGIRGRYILTVNFFRPRKNAKRLISAFALLKRRGAPVEKLVLVGGMPPGLKEKLLQAAPPEISPDIVFTGYVPDADLPLLYNAASVFAFPSFYEGFGLPPLEAMACGVPVVTSNTSALPEVVGDAGIMIDPHSVEQLAEAMQKILEDDTFAEELSQRGIERAKQFSWQETARQTMQIYEEAATK